MSNINQKLNGINPLSYIGVNSYQPPNIIFKNRAPTTTDSKNVTLGTWWLNTTTENLYYLGSFIEGGVPGAASWNIISSSAGSVIQLRADDLTVATPVAGSINISGQHGLNTYAAGNTMNIAINNAITLGDLAVITGSPAITLTTGDATITSGNINMSSTNSAGTIGIIKWAASRWIHNFGVFNTFVGQSAGNLTLTAGANSSTGIGAFALFGLTSGGSNTAVGFSSLSGTTTGAQNTAVGFQALTANTTGSSNTAVGSLALATSTTTSFNTAVGKEALTVATGDSNAALGYRPLFALTTGTGNVAIGYSTLPAITTGNGNVAVGTNAGLNLTAGDSQNIMIRNPGTAGDNNRIRLGTNPTHTTCFIAGIDGVNVGSVAKVVTMAAGATDQLGTATLTAGTGVTITPGANTITIAASGTTNLNYTAVSTTPYVVLTTDDYISVDSSGGVRTVQLPNAAPLGKVYIVKDRTGSAVANNITVTTVGGAVNIDGATTFVMNSNYESAQFIGNGTTWEIF